MPTLFSVAPAPSDTDPRLAQLALDLCLDDELAARYLASPAQVLAECGLAESADGSLIDSADLLPIAGGTIPAITWCFSTPDDDRHATVA